MGLKMDEKQSVTFALFFYISESPKGHLNLECIEQPELTRHHLLTLTPQGHASATGEFLKGPEGIC